MDVKTSAVLILVAALMVVSCQNLTTSSQPTLPPREVATGPEPLTAPPAEPQDVETRADCELPSHQPGSMLIPLMLDGEYVVFSEGGRLIDLGRKVQAGSYAAEIFIDGGRSLNQDHQTLYVDFLGSGFGLVGRTDATPDLKQESKCKAFRVHKDGNPLVVKEDAYYGRVVHAGPRKESGSVRASHVRLKYLGPPDISTCAVDLGARVDAVPGRPEDCTINVLVQTAPGSVCAPTGGVGTGWSGENIVLDPTGAWNATLNVEDCEAEYSLAVSCSLNSGPPCGTRVDLQYCAIETFEVMEAPITPGAFVITSKVYSPPGTVFDYCDPDEGIGTNWATFPSFQFPSVSFTLTPDPGPDFPVLPVVFKETCYWQNGCSRTATKQFTFP